MATAEATTTNTESSSITSTKPVAEATAMNVDEKKATEPITTSDHPLPEPTEQSEAELLSKGKDELKAEQFEKACNTLSDALRLTQEKGIATTIESVEYYIAYGEALLRYAQSSNDLFGAAVRESQQQHIQEDEEEEEDAVPMVTDATTTDNTENSDKAQNPENAQSSDIPQSNGHSKEEQDEEVPAEPQVDPQEDPQEDAQENAPSGFGDVDTSEDREIAWETFEYARSIMEEYLAADGHQDDDEHRKKLATVHSFLGEICLEDERHEAALQEFDTALALQSQCKDGVVSCRERATNHYWACLAGQCAGQMEVALKHCGTALDCLSDKIQSLCSHFEAEEECKSHDDVVAVADRLLETLDDAQKDSEDGKELKALVGVMAELSETKKEVERMILKQQEEPQADANGQGMANIMDAADPLAAMINGLIQSCGVDEEELAKMEAMAGGNDENTNNGNNSNQGQGVTTIGFGNQAPVDEDEPVHELNVVKTKRRKRNMQEAGISDDAAEEVKKMKLNAENTVETTEAAQTEKASS